MPVSKIVAASGIALLFAVACSDDETKTGLNPEGPPMVRQVFAFERVLVDNGAGGTVERTKLQLAFGTHADALPEEDDGEVINALALGQEIRIVMDELLDGSTLEDIACADGTFDAIPSGTTPDDIAECAGVDRRDCTAVCTEIGPDNQPVGILDTDEDGAADDLQFKEDVVHLTCGGVETDLQIGMTFWQPSGNQQVPAGDIGLGGLGPAIILVPVGLRTGVTCGITFDNSVVDKDGERVCAPPDGDVEKDCPGDGDTDLIEFGVQVFKLLGSTPINNQEGVALTSPVLLQFNQRVDAQSATANITMADTNGPVVITAVPQTDDPALVTVTVTGGLQPLTEYTLTVNADLEEIFGGTLADDIVITFTTRDAAPVPDAGIPDAGLPDA